MNLILNNPYRILGLLVGTTVREHERQVKRLKFIIDAGQDPPVDFSFPILGQLNRAIDSITDAASKLNLDSDKMNAALFWFWNGNPITDEAAFDALKDGDVETAYQIWDKLITETKEDGKRFWKPITKKNYSAFHNCSIINIIRNNGNLHNGIVSNLYFLESDLVDNFVLSIADKTYKTNKKELQLMFLNQLYVEIEANKKSLLDKFLKILNEKEFIAKQDFMKVFVKKLIEQIEKKIEEAKTKRKANNSNAVNIGKVLFEQTSENLKQLKSILGTSNLKFTSISDKVSDEIMQCGIDYFSHYKDLSTDPSGASMDLFCKAKTLAIGNIAKQKCQENTENLQKWIDDKPERDKLERIFVDFEKLKNLIDEYEGQSKTIANGKLLLKSARPYLNNVKIVLGSTDELYLGLSSRIASEAQEMCVSEINNLQERFAFTFDDVTKLASIFILKEKVNEAWDVITTIGSMDLRQNFRIQYTQNRTSLSNLKTQLAAVNTGRGRSSSASGGCYIATMAYGDYDHPQVMILRQFRDEVLDKSAFGKWFIKTYYHYSPKLVEKLKNKRRINAIIRITLNQFIKLIK